MNAGRGTLCHTAVLMGMAVVATALLAQSGEMERLEAMRARDPKDPIVLYNLAALHAAAGHKAQAVQLLDEVSRAPGGLDPSFYRGFFFLRGDLAYDDVVARIRAANPPRVRSSPAFTITEPDLHPEGIAFDSVTRSIFAGSFKGKIVRVDARGVTSVFAQVPQAEAPHVVLGLRVDSGRGHLWAVVDDPRTFGDVALGGAALHQYEIATGRLVARYPGPPTGALNDVVVAPNGDAIATNTSDGSLWLATPGTPATRMFLPAGTVLEANGLALSPDGRNLFVAGWHDIMRVDMRTRELTALAAPAGLPAASFDGLYYYDGGLVGIQNGVHPGRVVRLTLDAAQRRITKGEVLETYHPLFNGVTTGALDGNSLLYFANTQSRSFKADGAPLDGVTLDPIVILRLPLD